MAQKVDTIDDYIRTFPADVQRILQHVRRTIRNVAPGADETISYQMPTFNLNGRSLVHFAGWKHHIALYPIPAVGEALEREVSPYRASEGTLRFPLKKPIPFDLIERLVALHVEANLNRES